MYQEFSLNPTAPGTATYDLSQGASPTSTAYFFRTFPHGTTSVTEVIFAAPSAVPVRTFYGWGVRHEPADLTNPPKLIPQGSACARHSFQQMARIPCYRGVRTR